MSNQLVDWLEVDSIKSDASLQLKVNEKIAA